MMDSKAIILSAIDKSNKKAVLDFKDSGEECSGSIRLYNFKDVPRGILTLGFLINNQVFKAALTEKANSFYSFNFKKPKSTNQFSCALINILGGEPTPLLIGSSEKSPPTDLSSSLVKNFKYLDEPQLSAEDVERKLNDFGIDYDDEEKKEIEKTLDMECDEKRCSNCGYRKAFYDDSKDVFIETNFDKTKIKDEVLHKKLYPLNNNNDNFYSEIKDQLNLLFEKYPEETFLTEVIPDSKWVKVDYEDDGNYIVIGLMYENDNVRFVCYGSPGEFSKNPPAEFKGVSQWLPLDP
ncbi:MAG: hypothetical protein PHS54_06085, partial [Clostridia bacterium]|nr:hypothetical protein [Clostridia bacterium]